jgi:uncharacterized membrane protein YjgN (DUF898 family)
MENHNVTPVVESQVSSTESDRSSTVNFHGRTGEYYAIWIVNILLTIVTLGIYSAWAKVRTERYFKANTEIDGHRLSYLAQPLQILKGRIIALVIFIGFYFVTSISPIGAVVLLILYFALVPWILCQSIKFNMQMVGYRNIRFNFHGKYGQAFLAFVLYPILSIFTLYLALPLALKTMDKFIYDNISYGDKPLTTNLKASSYYKASFGALVIAIVLFAISMFAFGLEMSSLAGEDGQVAITVQLLFMATYLAVFIISGAFYTKTIRNHLYNNSEIASIASFKSNVTLVSLMFLMGSNLLVLICTLGLALPWVKIRTAKYYSQVTEVKVLAGANAVIADKIDGVSAIGDEISEVFDFDIAIT